MRIPKGIRDNLHFLITEVGSQLDNLQSCFDTASVTVAQRILDRSGYTSNLKQRIHSSCLGEIAKCQGADADTTLFRALETIATDLDRIAELCRDCIQQMGHLSGKRRLDSGTYTPLLELVEKGVGQIERAVRYNDTRIALKIGRVEEKLDRSYKKLLQRYSRKQHKKTRMEDLIAALFVAHCIEQMGDVLLDISEAIISANLGQPINTDRYYSLKASAQQLDTSEDFSDLAIEPLAETRSGSGISAISNPATDEDSYLAIFKDGKKRKLKEEREVVESWHEIFPGLAPRILSYHKRGQSAALLIEHLAGLTFEQVLLNESPKLLRTALNQLISTLESVWQETHTSKPVSAGYMRQLAKRLDEVYANHPEFRQGESRICGYSVHSFDALLRRARKYEARLRAPFSVYIHGDFNVDNIIYDPMEDRINFIDLHRSSYMDYVQDVSVFMVSNYRLQVLDAPLRKRILKLSRDFYSFAAAYAKKTGDRTFELRLALGLARSFATSTRFILDKTLARGMFLRARYLIEQVLATDPEQAQAFRVPVKEIFIG